MSRNKKKRNCLQWPVKLSRMPNGGARLVVAAALMPNGGARLVVAAAFILSLLYLSGMNRTLQLAGEVENLKQSCEALKRQVDRRELEIARERDGERIVELARTRLGMDFPEGHMKVLAVLPAATRPGGTLRTYIDNALVMTIGGIERHLNPSAYAREASPPDSSGGP